MSNRLVVRLLGPFDVDAPSGQISSFEAATARGLLAYVAANHPHPQARAQLAALLWGPDAGPTGLTNLRSALRRVLHAVRLEDAATPCLLAGRETVQIHPDIALELDVEIFEAHLAAVQTHSHSSLVECRVCAERQRQAVALFRGDFLSDLDIANEPFEQWRDLMKERYRRQAMRTLHALADHESRNGSLVEAERYARRQLELEHWNEESHRQLMRILLATGRRSAALAQYETCYQVLRTELGVVPSEETDALYEQLLAGAARPVVRRAQNPYKGLAAFGVADAPNFFGREQIAQVLLSRIENEPFLALIGPSGSGKSSLLFAGLASALSANGHTGEGQLGSPPPQWQVVSMRPGATPLHALTEALPALGYTPPAQGSWLDLLLNGELVLEVASASDPRAGFDGAEIVPSHGSPRRLLIVDQFEELFTLCRDGTTRAAFLRFLLSVLANAGGGPAPVVVLVAMRADFMGQVLQDGGLAAALQQHFMLLAPMTHQELRRAIAEPVRLQGMVFEPGLVERLLVDVGSEPGRLPLLQFALTTLWLRQQDGWLTHATYNAIGGVRGALAEYTDETYLQLSLPEQQAARRVFLNLVEPGLDAQDVRRVATRAEIGDEQWPIVQRLADARLLVTNRDLDGNETAEMAHEALIREWRRLREWLEADRTFRNWQQQMRQAAEHWRRSGHEDGPLLRGGRLAEAARWLSERQPDVVPLVRDYVEAGIALRQRRHSEEAALRERQLHQMQTAAAAEHRRAEAETAARRRMRWLTIGAILASLIALGAAVFAVQAQQRAEEIALVAQSRRLIAQAISVMHAKPDLALLLGVEALRFDASAESTMALFTDLDIPPMLDRILHGRTSPVDSLELTDSGEVVTGNQQGAISIWDSASGSQRERIDFGQGPVSHTAISPDGRHVAMLADGRITLREIETQTPLLVMDGNSRKPSLFTYTRDGRRLLSAGADGLVLLWNAESGNLVQQLQLVPGRSPLFVLNDEGTKLLLGDSDAHPNELLMWDAGVNQPIGEPLVGHTDALHGYAVNPEGTMLATASFDGSVRLWNILTGEAMGEPLLGHQGRVLFVEFSSDGRLLASGGTDFRVLLWDVASYQQLGPPLIGHSNWVSAGRFSADGRSLVTGDEGGGVFVWNLHALRILLGHSDRVRSLALSPDQSTLVTSGFDSRLIVWDAGSLRKRQMIATPHENAIISIGYSPDGSTLVSVDGGGRIGFWDAATWKLRFPLERVSEQALIGLAFSPDGQTVAVGGMNGVVHLWDVATGRQRQQPIKAYDGEWALSVLIDPSGQRLVTGGKNGAIKIWDLATGAPMGAPLIAHEGNVTDLAFTADGSILTSAGKDGKIRFWDLESRREAAPPLDSGSAQVWSLRYIDDHPSHLLALGGDGAVADWDIEQRVLNRPLERAYIETEEMRVADSGDRAFVASTRSIAVVLTLNQGDWRERACAIANRALTRDEWGAYMDDLPYAPACR